MPSGCRMLWITGAIHVRTCDYTCVPSLRHYVRTQTHVSVEIACICRQMYAQFEKDDGEEVEGIKHNKKQYRPAVVAVIRRVLLVTMHSNHNSIKLSLC